MVSRGNKATIACVSLGVGIQAGCALHTAVQGDGKPGAQQGGDPPILMAFVIHLVDGSSFSSTSGSPAHLISTSSSAKQSQCLFLLEWYILTGKESCRCFLLSGKHIAKPQPVQWQNVTVHNCHSDSHHNLKTSKHATRHT